MMGSSVQVFERLMAVIEQRRDSPPERSYTQSLLQAGITKIGAKITEEATELVQAAAAAQDAAQRAHVRHEAADLVYHLFVLLAHQRIALVEVADELDRRFGTSGLEEKASRSAGKDG
jgi:phosphoribosyl-ATP pyrophosphohydrolase